MYEIKEKTRLVDGKMVATWKREIIEANILEIEVGTNGFKGGDTGHGSRTYLRIKDLSSTDIKVNVLKTNGCIDGVEIELGGDCELVTLIEALEFAVHVLKDQSGRMT